MPVYWKKAASKATKAAAGSDFPVSVKTRVGFTTIDLSWIEFLLQQKLNMLTIHARTTKEMSKVPAHYELFEQIVALRDKLSPPTLIVANGDITSRSGDDARSEEHTSELQSH